MTQEVQPILSFEILEQLDTESVVQLASLSLSSQIDVVVTIEQLPSSDLALLLHHGCFIVRPGEAGTAPHIEPLYPLAELVQAARAICVDVASHHQDQFPMAISDLVAVRIENSD